MFELCEDGCMNSSTPFAALADTSVEFVLPVVDAVPDDELLADKVLLAEIRRRVDAADAVISAELAHRSRPELGYSGLAQRMGARTPEKLIQDLTGVSARDARTQVRVGTLISAHSAYDPDASPPDALDPADESAPTSEAWLADVAVAVASGALTLNAADAIRTGLGTPTDDVSVAALTEAATTLLRESNDLTVEKLAARARELRAALDIAHVADLEAALRDKRYLRLRRLPTGMTALDGLLDPESAAELTAIVDAATSPRRGGPRFVDPELAQQAEALISDARTTEQIALDTFVQLLRLGTGADSTAFLGARRPAAQLLVTLADLETGTGAAYFEGHGEPVSIATARRAICDAGVTPILFGESGEVLNLGRELRLFTRRQRQALAARDGGCIWPGCDRPPSWCEAHHINEWFRDHGRTDVADGVLLCRHHHMLLHNNSWRITRSGTEYSLIPPTSIDPEQKPRHIRQGNPALRRLAVN